MSESIKKSIADIDLGDKFKDDQGVLWKITSFAGSVGVVCRRVVGAVPGSADQEFPLNGALLAKIRFYESQRGQT